MDLFSMRLSIILIRSSRPGTGSLTWRKVKFWGRYLWNSQIQKNSLYQKRYNFINNLFHIYSLLLQAAACCLVPISVHEGGACARNSVLSLKPTQTRFLPCQPFQGCLVLIHSCALLAFFCQSKVKPRFPYQKENIRFDITFEELTPVTKVLQVFPSILEGNHAIGRNSIQGFRGAVEKTTALEGYPTGQFLWGK